MIVETNVIASATSTIIAARSHPELPYEQQREQAELSVNALSALTPQEEAKTDYTHNPLDQNQRQYQNQGEYQDQDLYQDQIQNQNQGQYQDQTQYQDQIQYQNQGQYQYQGQYDEHEAQTPNQGEYQNQEHCQDQGQYQSEASGTNLMTQNDLEQDGEFDDDQKSESCCYVADDMAGDDQKAEKYIVDIPYSVLLSIYQSLDADKGWESLASETGYTFDKIRLLELEGARNQGSPSRSLLWELGSRNTTVRQLYGYLSALSRYREMKILEDYVNSPSKPTSVDNGLRGLKSPSSFKDTSRSNRFGGPPSPSSSMPNKKPNNTSSMSSDSINFNQPPSSSDANNSMKFTEKEKHYTGKQIPMAPNVTPSPPSASGNQPPSFQQSPGSIKIPCMRPSNPSRSVGSSCSANIVRNMVRQMPGGTQNCSPNPPASHPSSPYPQGNHTSSTSSPSSESESRISSSLFSSLPGLDSSLEAQMAVRGSVCFSYSEIIQATNNFSLQNKIGEGAFGTVYFGVLRHNKCAVKKMFEPTGQETVQERSTQVQRELTSLLKFRHENIVTLYGYASEGESLCLIYQFMPNGSLEDRLMCKNNTSPLVWSQRLNILLGVCQGLNFLHTAGEQPLIHGDIKSANILLDKHLEAKIGDLGQAQHATARGLDSTTRHFTHITRAETSTKLYGTKAYQPTELQTGGAASVKSDVYSMGVVILEVFSGEKAYDERREGEQFLGEYFRSLKEESGDEACMAKMDRRGGECPHEVALAVLNMASECTHLRKKARPKSTELLQKIICAEQLYRDKTGMKLNNIDSMPGSEHSCHMSHASSPDRSVDNLAGAPPLFQPHRKPTPQQSSKAFDINLNTTTASPKDKLYSSQLVSSSQMAAAPHSGNLSGNLHPDNRLAVNMNVSSSPPEHPARQDSQSSSLGSGPRSQGTSSPVANPITCFPQGQPLPPAFRLQQAYDKQKECPSEAKKRISRLSQVLPSGTEDGQGEGEFPQSDPAKLAALQQFDQGNFQAEEKEVNALQSDPKKLAMLKDFDENLHHPTEESAEGHNEGSYQQDNLSSDPDHLACDPRKLAYLRQFDQSNCTPEAGNIVQQTQREEEQMLTSDPHKLAALRQFDSMSTSSQEEAARRQCDSANTSLVSQLDYVVVPSQREALEACRSMALHQKQAPFCQDSTVDGVQHLQNQQTMLQSVANLSHCSLQDGSISSSISASRSQETDHSAPNVSSNALSNSSNENAAVEAKENLLLRQKHFFEMYNKALENIDDNEDEECYDNNEDNEEEEEEVGVESYNNSVGEDSEKIANGVSEVASHFGQCSVGEEGSAGGLLANGHYTHPTPNEQEETRLNYFKQREQHYAKTFKKPAQPSQC